MKNNGKDGYTVCFLFNEEENKILLGIKGRNTGEGRWNGYGGHIRPNETPRKAAVRELREETGGKNGVIVLPDHLEKVAEITPHNFKSDGGIYICTVHFYLAREWKGNIIETKEIFNPTWFKIEELPFAEMIPSDEKWMRPVFFEGKKVKAQPKLGPEQRELLEDFKIEIVDRFDD